MQQSAARAVEALGLASEPSAVTFIIHKYVEHRLALVGKPFVELSQIAHYVNEGPAAFLALEHPLPEQPNLLAQIFFNGARILDCRLF
jgi:hypothetical protein